MNLQELINEVEPNDPAMAARLKAMAPEGHQDLTQFKVEATFKLEKFHGDYEPGKQPYEVIQGGDGLPTTVTIPA